MFVQGAGNGMGSGNVPVFRSSRTPPGSLTITYVSTYVLVDNARSS
jgi:hypothetical protein